MTSDFLFGSLETLGLPLVLSDPEIDDNPMVFVNSAFERLTGWSRAEAIGRNCRFLQGPGTEPAAVAAIRRGLCAREPLSVSLLNYRRDGSSFLNALNLGPVFDEQGTLVYWIGAMVAADSPVARQGDCVERHAVALLSALDRAPSPGPAARRVRTALDELLRETAEGVPGRPGT